MKKIKKIQIVLLLLILAIIIGVAYVGLNRWAERWKSGTAVLLVATGIYFYHEQYKDLPENFSDIAKTGVVGLDEKSSYDPATNQVRIHNIPVYYLKASQPGFIAVYMPISSKQIGYIIAPDPRTYFTTPEEMQKLLKSDNQKRLEANQPTWELSE